MHLQDNSLPFLPLTSCFMTFWLGHVPKSKFWDIPLSLGFSIFEFFFHLSFFSFSFLFAVVIDLSLDLLPVKKLPRKRHQDRQFLLWCSQVLWQEILFRIFHSTFWASLCLSQAPFSQSPWSGHHWKDVFLLQKLSIDDANFGQKRWHQKWKKGRRSSRPVTAGTGVNGLSKIFWKDAPYGCQVISFIRHVTKMTRRLIKIILMIYA